MYVYMNLGRSNKSRYSIYRIMVFGLLLMAMSSCETGPTREMIIEHKVDSLLAIMTLEEKIGQMSQVRHFDDITGNDVATKLIGSVIHTQGPLPGETPSEWQARFRELQEQALSTRLGIPLLFGVDAVHGQNTYNGSTIFPHNIGLGATQNPEVVRKAAEITAIEMHATGFNWAFSPCVAIPYNEKWGRVFEAFSESTELTSKLTVASVEGLQKDMQDKYSVLATAKHFIGDGATDFGKEGGNTSLSREEISKRLLPPYRAAVNSGIGSIMVSFNSVWETNMHAHKELITDTLKNGMGFTGMVLTDWKGFSRFGGIDIINAGVDMVMAVDGDLDLFQDSLKKSVLKGHVSNNRIDDAVRRILRQKFRLGIFENPYPDSSVISIIGCKEHRDMARMAVRQSLVLLKNQENTLPISKETKKIVVVGEHADNSGLQSGGWTITWWGTSENYNGSKTILDGIRQIAKGEIIYDTMANEIVSDADAAIIVVGEKPYVEFFGDIGDGTGDYTLTLKEEHQRYIKTYSDLGIPTIVILVSGRPLVTTKQIDQSDAFVAAWLPGSEGDGIGEVLFGNYNFIGKLPHSWPADVSQYDGKFGPNHWDNDCEPLFELGYGLKYENNPGNNMASIVTPGITNQ